MRSKTILSICFYLIFCLPFNRPEAQTSVREGKMQRLINENFAFADSQYRYMMTLIQNDRMPQSYDEKNNRFITYDISWWCSGFYAGSLWYIYEQTRDEMIRKEAERCLGALEPNQNFTGNHDIGFMMNCSFGNGYRITGNARYKDILFTSAASLATRYRPSIQSIQSWDKSKRFECPVIIDNMMNLELLYWVSNSGGDKKYKDIAIAHANTTLKNHYRPDHSSFHVVDYDLTTGKVIRKVTWQGAANCSPWARGQAWGLYGFTTMYRFSKNKTYLNHAKHIAGFILNHPNLPKDKIPYWDFEAPFIPNANRDASAGAIIASALLELGQYTTGAERKKYVDAATLMIESLSSYAYRAKRGENGGFLLKHSTGALPQNSEIDVPLVYADYYFLEALKRYKDWYL
ncbi:glycoside hydrolase family 88 protein [Niastella vici]|uniref:glycoside hydrolase family 88 protein n=1 Tax=Niastella vici TaxID=1703345 RepID=UPI0009BDDD78|nr:glycoside hydrolase family 88 protein [Niastella vici]